ncbi:MAG: phosphoribosylglycinamide formyltransferase [Deltaproteobacteria bacterium]|nr:phosphoribosylglycinamide formyltransferase [Deltaproteobacteria bacterium]
MRIAVLASGGGTNLQALLDAQAAGALAPAQIVVVGANVPGCGALGRAESAGVPTFCLSHKGFAERAAFDEALYGQIVPYQVDCLVLAGFMRVLTAAFLERFAQGVINIHPALLPAFPGVHGQKQAFEYGVKFAGCTVHYVDGGVDSGPIIAQAVVPVLPNDSEASLQQRILEEEHKIFPAVVQAVAAGRVQRQGRRVLVAGEPVGGLQDARLRTIAPLY